MIRSHVIGKREVVQGCVMHHTYTFYEDPGAQDMRIVELFIDTYDSKPFNDPKLYREYIHLIDPKTSFPIPVYVDGKQYNERPRARTLYKMLLGMGFTPYTS